MLKLVIVDDDKIFLNNIYRCVTDYSCLTNIEFDITLYDNSKALNDDIWKKTAYDIYLLDVEIPEMDGFKLAQKIQEYHKTALIIFITSHVEYAVLGYEYSIFRYICKINLEEKLPGALSEAVKRLAVNSNCYYTILNNRRFDQIPYKEIIYLYKSQKNTVLVTNETQYKVRKTLKTVYKELASEEFVFIERDYILNLAYLQTLHENIAVLLDGTKLPVSSSHQKNVTQKIHTFLEIRYDDII